MTPERHARIQEIFEAAIDLPTLRRISYLDEACRGDPDLRLRIDKLIHTAEVTDTIIYDAPEQNAQSPDPAAARECPRCSRCFEGPITFCPEDGSRLELAFQGPLLIDSKYHVEHRLGRGGMGAVYLARHVGLERPFALKLILRKGIMRPWYRESFEREARALGRLKHPNIVDVTDYGVDPRGSGLPYLVMEYLEGRTLRQVLQEERALPFEKAVVLLRAAAEAIDTAHAQNIIHGDLKPSNLFLSYAKNSHELSLKVLDFGLARLAPVSQNGGPATSASPDADCENASGRIQGTPAYMAPELLKGCSATPASDRFAFGVVTYELLTGSPPFGSHLWQAREKLKNSPPALSCRNPQLPVELDAPVLALLEDAPERRPTSATAAVSAMEQAWLRAEQRRWRARETVRRLVIAALMTPLLVLIAGLFSRSRIARMLEDRIVDARFGLVTARPPDPRLLIISLDDATLAEDQRPLADRADEFGRALERIFQAGARAVGIDLLLPLTWRESPEFARVVSKRADRLVLGLFSAPSGEVIGGECVSQLTSLTLGADRYAELFAFVNLQDDDDGTVRHTQLSYLDSEGRHRQSFAGRLVSAASLAQSKDRLGDTPTWIDYSVHPQSIPKMSWKDVEARLNSAPKFFRDRIILVGADYSGSGDEHRIPAASGSTMASGVLVQALIANTVAAGFPVHDPGIKRCLSVAGLVCFAIVAAGLCFPHRFRLALIIWAGLCCSYAFGAFWIFRSSRIMIPVAAPEVAVLLSVFFAWCVKSYLPAYPTSVPAIVKGA